MNIYMPYSINRDIFKGEELKYAIRSIEKYLTGWEDIILIGTPPDWFNGKVIEANDIEGRKEESIYKKLMLIEDHIFLRWDDDHYLLKPLHISGIKNWYDGELKDYTNGTARYRMAIQKTLELRPGALNYDIHAPMTFFSEDFRDLFRAILGDICVKTFYRESIVSAAPEQMTDLKISRYLSAEEIKKQIEGRLFFSTGTLFDPMREVLNELYPTKSKYEK